MLIRIFVFLLILLACNNNERIDDKYLEAFIYPDFVDTASYKTDQRSMRLNFIQRNSELNEDFILSKDVNNKKISVHFEQFPIYSNMIIPKRFNLDIKREFVVPEYASRLTYIEAKDTLFILKIDKSLFNDLLDSNLKNYGVLYYEGNYNSLKFWEDSIVLNYNLAVPATFINKKVFLKTSLSGEYRIFEMNGL